MSMTARRSPGLPVGPAEAWVFTPLIALGSGRPDREGTARAILRGVDRIAAGHPLAGDASALHQVPKALAALVRGPGPRGGSRARAAIVGGTVGAPAPGRPRPEAGPAGAALHVPRHADDFSYSKDDLDAGTHRRVGTRRGAIGGRLPEVPMPRGRAASLRSGRRVPPGGGLTATRGDLGVPAGRPGGVPRSDPPAGARVGTWRGAPGAVRAIRPPRWPVRGHPFRLGGRARSPGRSRSSARLLTMRRGSPREDGGRAGRRCTAGTSAGP